MRWTTIKIFALSNGVQYESCISNLSLKGILNLAISHDGKVLAVITNYYRGIALIGIDQKVLIFERDRREMNATGLDVAFSIDKTCELLVIAGNSLLTIIDWKKNAVFFQPNDLVKDIYNCGFGVAFSPKHPELLASAYNKGTVLLWNISKKMLVSELFNKGGAFVNCIGFSPANYLAVGYGSEELIVWGVEKKEQLVKICDRETRSNYTAVIFFANDSLVTTLGNGTIQA